MTDPNTCTYCATKFSPRRGIHILHCDTCDKPVCDSCLGIKEWHYDYATDTGSDILCPECGMIAVPDL